MNELRKDEVRKKAELKVLDEKIEAIYNKLGDLQSHEEDRNEEMIQEVEKREIVLNDLLLVLKERKKVFDEMINSKNSNKK